MAEDITTSIESIVGHANGELIGDNEVVVYDYDKDGQFIGWHKSVQGAK